MIRLSLTDFVDIVSRSGIPKATKIGEVKARPDYEPAFDFYKQLRDFIVDMHRGGKGKAELNTFYTTINDRKKKANYPSAINGYRKWLGRKTITWFDPARTNYNQNDINLMINPELGLVINGKPHLVKLYFKKDKLSKLKIDIITLLMEISLRRSCSRPIIMSVLDIRNSKLFTYHEATTAKKAIIDAELAYISMLWPEA